VEVFGKVMRHIAGDEKIPVQLDDIQLELLPRSFFQLNTKQAETLYKKVADIMPASKLVVEAYSGIGGIAFAAAKKADKIIGIEAVADAVENAKANSENNHIENVEFLCGDAAEELENIADNEDVDTLIVDPPRSGLGERMIEAIKFSQPKNIVYVSCNPSTLAKDIAELSAYEIAYVQPLDMFSQTPHVETICLLKQKKASADKGEE
jgi:23S rRNA (uracil-5-)-methyltransferase RumA